MRLFARFSSANKEALAYLDEESTTFQFNLKGEKPFYIVANNKGMKFHEGNSKNVDVTFTSDKETFYKIFSGQLSQDEAFVNRQLEVKGAMLVSAKFRRVSNMMLESHKSLLKLLRVFVRIIPL
jgi:putative sterol carrier protein